MYKEISFADFCAGFEQSSRTDQFSYGGLRGLFNYLEELESDTGERIEFDPIALCCEFTEYTSAQEAAQDYGWTPSKYEDDEEGDDEEEDFERQALEWLEDRTLVITLSNGGVLIQDF